MNPKEMARQNIGAQVAKLCGKSACKVA